MASAGRAPARCSRRLAATARSLPASRHASARPIAPSTPRTAIRSALPESRGQSRTTSTTAVPIAIVPIAASAARLGRNAAIDAAIIRTPISVDPSIVSRIKAATTRAMGKGRFPNSRCSLTSTRSRARWTSATCADSSGTLHRSPLRCAASRARSVPTALTRGALDQLRPRDRSHARRPRAQGLEVARRVGRHAVEPIGASIVEGQHGAFASGRQNDRRRRRGRSRRRAAQRLNSTRQTRMARTALKSADHRRGMSPWTWTLISARATSSGSPHNAAARRSLSVSRRWWPRPRSASDMRTATGQTNRINHSLPGASFAATSGTATASTTSTRVIACQRRIVRGICVARGATTRARRSPRPHRVRAGRRARFRTRSPGVAPTAAPRRSPSAFRASR